MAYTNSKLVNYTRISPNRSVNRNHKIDTISIHCVVGQCSVETLGSIFASPSKEASSNYGIGYDGRIGILDFMSLRFIDEKTNIIFIGSSGVGKTHLATAIGIEAAGKRISTYFINFAVLMEKFKQAAKENRVEKVVKHYLKYTVLIIDEIGYLPVDKDAAFGFFQLIAARYEFRPTILTTNQPFSKWTDVFGDAVIANAIIDRLVHHCEVIKITGNSYRIKGRKIFEDSDD